MIQRIIWMIISPFLLAIMMMMFWVEFVLRILINLILFIVRIFPNENKPEYCSISENKFLTNKVVDEIMSWLCV